MKRVKGIGRPKSHSPLSSYLNITQKEDNLLTQKIKELEDENAKLKEKIRENEKSIQFLTKEQQKVAMIEKSSIKNWSQEGIIYGLRLRFALGKFGYEYLRATGYPSPSYSTLNRRMQGIKMNFGILDSFVNYMKTKVDLMSFNDRWCSIIIDEMEISKIKDFDTATKSFIGGVTLGPRTAKGTHYTVVLLRGMKSKWKQVIAHEITGPSTPGTCMKELVHKMLEANKELGLGVKAIVSDMGSNNRAMWKEFGINVSRTVRNTTYNIKSDIIHSVADVPPPIKKSS